MSDEIVPIIILVGPSGSGKTSVINMLVELGAVTRVKSSTTRPIRPEEDETSYNFCSTADEFFSHSVLEHDIYDGNLYGTTAEAIKEAADTGIGFPILAMTYEGAVAVSKHYGECVITIYLYATPNVIIDRLRKRGETYVSINSRLDSSKRELQKSIVNKMNYVDYLIDTTKCDEKEVINHIIYTILSISNDTRFIRGSHNLFLAASNEIPEEWRIDE